MLNALRELLVLSAQPMQLGFELHHLLRASLSGRPHQPDDEPADHAERQHANQEREDGVVQRSLRFECIASGVPAETAWVWRRSRRNPWRSRSPEGHGPLIDVHPMYTTRTSHAQRVARRPRSPRRAAYRRWHGGLRPTRDSIVPPTQPVALRARRDRAHVLDPHEDVDRVVGPTAAVVVDAHVLARIARAAAATTR